MLRRLLLFVVLLLPAAAQAQPIALRFALQPGVPYRLTEWSTLEMRSSIAFGGQMPEDSTTMHLVSSGESDFAAEVQGDDLLVTRTERRRRIWSDGPGGIEVADSDSAASLAGNPNAVLVSALIGVPVQVRMTRTGRGIEVVGREALRTRLMATLPDMSSLPEAAQMMQQSIDALLDRTASLAWTLPEAALAVGGTWTDTTAIAGLLSLEQVQQGTLAAVVGDTAQVRFTTTQQMPANAPPFGAGPMAIQMRMQGTGTGEARLHLPDGTFTLRQRSVTTGQGSPAQDTPALPGLQMRMWQRMESRVTLARAEG